MAAEIVSLHGSHWHWNTRKNDRSFSSQGNLKNLAQKSGNMVKFREILIRKKFS